MRGLTRHAALAVVGMLASFAFEQIALAQDGAGTDGNGDRSAYKYALECWAANGVIVTDPVRNPRRSKDTAFDGSAKRAYDAAYLFGERLGLGKSEIAIDLKTYGVVAGSAMLRDQSYYERTLASCRQLGLMP